MCKTPSYKHQADRNGGDRDVADDLDEIARAVQICRRMEETAQKIPDALPKTVPPREMRLPVGELAVTPLREDRSRNVARITVRPERRHAGATISVAAISSSRSNP